MSKKNDILWNYRKWNDIIITIDFQMLNLVYFDLQLCAQAFICISWQAIFFDSLRQGLQHAHECDYKRKYKRFSLPFTYNKSIGKGRIVLYEIFSLSYCIIALIGQVCNWKLKSRSWVCLKCNYSSLPLACFVMYIMFSKLVSLINWKLINFIFYYCKGR